MSSDQSGVYCWINLVNGKRYVGSAARGLQGRKRQHLRALRKGTSPHRYLQNAWNKYGENNFEWVELHYCDPEECVGYEQKYLDQYDSSKRERGYNSSPTAGSPLGVKHTEKTKKKMSEAVKRGWAKPEVREKYSAAMKKRYERPGEREKMSEAVKRGWAKPEVRERMSAAAKKRFEKPGEREKTSEATKKRYENPKAREKSSAAHGSTITKEDGVLIKALYRSGGYSFASLAKQFNTSDTTVCSIIHNRHWTTASEPNIRLVLQDGSPPPAQRLRTS